MSKLPFAEKAVLDVIKLRDYVLSPLHPKGRHKAKVFLSALGIGQREWMVLRDALLDAARDEEAVLLDADEYGQRYAIDFEISREQANAAIRSTWIIRRGERIPRFVSCYVKKKRS